MPSPLADFNGKNDPAAAIFMSGSGTLTERFLKEHTDELMREEGKCPFRVCAIVTDAPLTSRAREIAARFSLPCVECDIREFYRQNGEEKCSLRSERGLQLREMWTEELWKKLEKYEPDFGIFAGFESLCNISRHLPCLNVHPGDLTWLKDGKRHLVGLHAVPIEKAILEGLDHLRSSMILVTPFQSGQDVDAGILLGISGEMPIPVTPEKLEEFRRCVALRPPVPRPAGWSDELRDFAVKCQEKLKVAGDYPVLNRVVRDFAAGRFLYDESKRQLFYRTNSGNILPVKTVQYTDDARELIFR